MYKAGGGAIWASNTVKRGATKAVMQADGNFVVYAGSTPLCSTVTNGNANARLIVQDAGNLVIYNAAGTAIWASNWGSTCH
jgi:hypothetical protein